MRAPGTIQLDERRISVVRCASEAFVDKVENVTTGDQVRKGQPLLRVYSPGHCLGRRRSICHVAESAVGHGRGSRQRLLKSRRPPDLIAEIERTRKVPLTFTWSAPRDGVVLERNVVDGMRAMPGDVLFRIADHSVVWALADVAERDLGRCRGRPAGHGAARGYPDRVSPERSS